MNIDLTALDAEPRRIGNRWHFADGTTLPVIAGGDGPVEDGASKPADGTDAGTEPEAGAETPAEPDAGTTADEATEAGAVVEYALPDGWAEQDDDALTALHAQIGATLEQAKTEVAQRRAEGKALLSDVATLRNLQARQQEVADALAKRVEDRAKVDEALAEIGEVPLPEGVGQAGTRAAAAAAVVKVISERPPTIGQDGAEQTAGERTAAASQPEPWSMTRGGVAESADWRALANAGIQHRHTTIRPREGAVLASARVTDLDRGAMLTDSSSHNEKLIREAREAHLAARMEAGAGERLAAICDPPSIIRDATTCGTTDTPLQGALVNLTSDSGNALKYEYRQPTSIAAASGGVATWDETAQDGIDASDPDTWKPCIPIACASYDTEEAVEQVACYSVDAFTELSSPESVADFVQAKDRAFARHTEGWTLAKLDTFLHPITWDASSGAGAVPEVIEMILTALAQGTYGERLDLASGYSVFGSPGLLYALAADENRRAYRDASSSLTAVQGLVEAATGTSYVQLNDVANVGLDNTSAWGASPFSALPAVGGSPDTIDRLSEITYVLRVFNPSDFVRFTTGEATFGTQITLDQARQNQRGFFQRIFGGLMKPGCSPGFKITVTGLAVDGSRGGFLTPAAEALAS